MNRRADAPTTTPWSPEVGVDTRQQEGMDLDGSARSPPILLFLRGSYTSLTLLIWQGASKPLPEVSLSCFGFKAKASARAGSICLGSQTPKPKEPSATSQELPEPQVLDKSRSKQGCFGKCSHVFISQGGWGEMEWADHQQDATK